MYTTKYLKMTTKKIKSLVLFIFGVFNLLGQSNCDYLQEYQDLIDRGMYLKSRHYSDSVNFFLAAKLLCPDNFKTFEFLAEHQEKKRLDKSYIESKLPILKTFDHYSFFTFSKDLKFSIYDQDRNDNLSFFFCVIIGKGVGILKFNGSPLFPPVFDAIKHIGSGNFKVEKDSLFGVVNYLGDTIIDLQYPYSYEMDTILTVDPYTYKEILEFKKRQATKILSYHNKWLFAYDAEGKFTAHFANGNVILKGIEELERIDKEGKLFSYKKGSTLGIMHFEKGVLIEGIYTEVAYIDGSKLLLKSRDEWQLIEMDDGIHVSDKKYADYIIEKGVYALKNNTTWVVNYSEKNPYQNPVFNIQTDEKRKNKSDIFYRFNPETYDFDEILEEKEIIPPKLKLIRLGDKLLMKAQGYWSIFLPNRQKILPLLFDTIEKVGENILVITEGKFKGIAYYDKAEQTVLAKYFDDLVLLNNSLFLVSKGGEQSVYDARYHKIIGQPYPGDEKR